MLPFPTINQYGNQAPKYFQGNMQQITYNPVFSVRAECGYCSDNYGNIWVMGGVNGSSYYRDMWNYSTITDSWTNLTAFPASNRSSAAMCYNPDLNVLYSFGGSTAVPSLSNQKNDLYEYNLSTNVWRLITPSTSLPTAKVHANMQYYNNKLYLFGGYDVKDTWVFDIDTLAWSRVSDAPYVKKYGSNTVMKGSDMYCIGYNSRSSSTPCYLMRYDTLTDQWSTINSTTYPLGRIEFYNSLIVSIGYDDGTIYSTDLNNGWIKYNSSTVSNYPVDNGVFCKTSNGILSVYGKNGSGTVLNLIFRVT